MYRFALFLAILVPVLLRADDDTPLPSDDPKAVALYQACDKHDLDEVKNQILSGAPVDGHVSKYAFTPLIDAADNGHLDILKCLIDYRANLNLPDNEGSTPLLHACWEDKPECALALIDAGADVSLGSKAGRTPLMYAAMHGDDRIVQALIAHKVNLEASCDQGPAIIWAAANNHLSTVKLLGDAGANVNVAPADHSKLTVLGNAAAYNNLDMIDYLAGLKANVNLPDAAGDTPLAVAMTWKMPEAMASLIGHGANPDVADQNGETPLMKAARSGDVEMVRALVNAKANVDAANPQGETALTLAGARGYDSIVQLLKDAGAKKTDVHIVIPPNTDVTSSPRQEWALAVGAIYAVAGGLNPRVLGYDSTAEREQDGLKDSWGITDKATLFKELDDLRDSGHHAAFHALGLRLDQYTDDQFQQFLAAHADRAVMYTAARASYRKWKDRTGLAWDLCRSANLVSNSYAAGFIDEGEAWDRLFDIARRTQGSFSSWQEMSDNFLDGREIWANKRDPKFEALAKMLLNPQDPNSPWIRCKWDTAFPAAKTAPAPTTATVDPAAPAAPQ